PAAEVADELPVPVQRVLGGDRRGMEPRAAPRRRVHGGGRLRQYGPKRLRTRQRDKACPRDEQGRGGERRSVSCSLRKVADRRDEERGEDPVDGEGECGLGTGEASPACDLFAGRDRVPDLEPGGLDAVAVRAGARAQPRGDREAICRARGIAGEAIWPFSMTRCATP